MAGQADLSYLPIRNFRFSVFSSSIAMADQVAKAPPPYPTYREGNGKYGIKMKFPITISAKIWWFPYKTYFRTNAFRYYSFAILFVTFPLMWKADRMINAPANLQKWQAFKDAAKADKFRRPTLDDPLPGKH